MNSSTSPILCEIHAPRAAHAVALAEIAVQCARDVGQPLKAQPLLLGPDAGPLPVLTLHLPASLASSQHQVWCLACRLACFCPDARVSVLVHGEDSFAAVKSEKSLRIARPA